MPNYLILIFGVIFVELMLCFAFGLPDSLDHYRENAPNMVFADYQYMLMSSQDEDGKTIETNEETAEPFCMKGLLYPKKATILARGMGSGGDEGVMVLITFSPSVITKLYKLGSFKRSSTTQQFLVFKISFKSLKILFE